MRILLVAATEFELSPTLEYLREHGKRKNFFQYEYNDYIIYPLVTGVGSALTCFNMGRFSKAEEIDLAINIGVAGSFHQSIGLGKVVCVIKDRFADLGAEEKDASFSDIFELNLEDPNRFPFNEGWIYNDTFTIESIDLIPVNSITVNKVHGNEDSIARISKKYHPDIETMEGAAFAYAAKMMKLRYIQLRAISNFVEARNKNSWKLKESIANMNDTLIQLLLNRNF